MGARPPRRRAAAGRNHIGTAVTGALRTSPAIPSSVCSVTSTTARRKSGRRAVSGAAFFSEVHRRPAARLRTAGLRCSAGPPGGKIAHHAATTATSARATASTARESGKSADDRTEHDPGRRMPTTAPSAPYHASQATPSAPAGGHADAPSTPARGLRRSSAPALTIPNKLTITTTPGARRGC